MVCDPFVTALLGSDEHPSVMVWTEKGETIQDVAAFQERLKGKSNPKTTHILHRHTHVCPNVVCDGKIFASQEKFTNEAKEEGSKTLPADFRSSKVRGSQNQFRGATVNARNARTCSKMECFPGGFNGLPRAFWRER